MALLLRTCEPSVFRRGENRAVVVTGEGFGSNMSLNLGHEIAVENPVTTYNDSATFSVTVENDAVCTGYPFQPVLTKGNEKALLVDALGNRGYINIVDCVKTKSVKATGKSGAASTKGYRKPAKRKP